jgi:chromosome segregation ATPase
MKNTAEPNTAAELEEQIQTLETRRAELASRRDTLTAQTAKHRAELGAAIAAGDTEAEARVHGLLRDQTEALTGCEAALPVLQSQIEPLRAALKASQTREAQEAIEEATARLDDALTAAHNSLAGLWEAELRAAFESIAEATIASRHAEGEVSRLTGQRILAPSWEQNQRAHGAVRALLPILSEYFAGRPFVMSQAYSQAPREKAEKPQEWHKLAL